MDPAAPASPIGSPELAAPGSRFLAALIDGVFVAIVVNVPLLGPLVGIVYGLIKDAIPFLDGQSLGKRAMGIRAVRADTGAPITGDYVSSVLRQLSLCIPFFNVVDALMVFTEGRRRFGDRWAKTIVVTAP
jgi:uncharacterized RDD family membrane protein YckC